MNEGERRLEQELARQLAPVPAPETLWDRICNPRPAAPRGMPIGWVAWPAAVMAVMVFAGVYWNMNRTREPLAELPPASHGFDFRSDDFGAIRKWVKTESNIDIDLPDDGSAGSTAPVMLLGVRLIRFRGAPAAAIDYHIGEDAATLVVSGKKGGLSGNTDAGKHLFSAMKASGNQRLLSWNMHDQNYTIAFSGEKKDVRGALRGACLLCHSNPRSTAN